MGWWYSRQKLTSSRAAVNILTENTHFSPMLTCLDHNLPQIFPIFVHSYLLFYTIPPKHWLQMHWDDKGHICNTFQETKSFPKGNIFWCLSWKKGKIFTPAEEVATWQLLMKYSWSTSFINRDPQWAIRVFEWIIFANKFQTKNALHNSVILQHFTIFGKSLLICIFSCLWQNRLWKLTCIQIQLHWY